ncbi:hypothetical protein JCM10212_001041 [Sporobolomyces blumeae]
MALGLPRKAFRALRYLVLALVVFALCYSRACSPTRSGWFDSASHSNPAPSTRIRQHPTDFAWGSIIHRFQNHPRPATRRNGLPWKRDGTRRGGTQLDPSRTGPIRVLIVTSELSGLHKNGGIGTAFVELAETLAGEDDVETSILVAHLEDGFPAKKVADLRSDFEKKRIRLQFVEQERQPFWPQAWTPVASLRVWNHLRQRDGEYDIVHFPDNTGIGYFSALAKHEGLALQQTRLVVGLHGADVEWAAMLNKRYPQDRYAVELGVFERRTAEFADAVVAPSEYMLEYVRSRGWELPSQAYVIPNIVKLDLESSVTSRSTPEPIDEIVFFGRLEERKGTRLLVSALESLYSSTDDPSSAPPALKMVTFLGRDQPEVKTRMDASALLGEALASIKGYTNATFEYQFLKTYDRDEALAYLQDPRRLAVLPSLADNSPSTVLECIAHGIRFIASDVGGLPELVHPEDHARVLFKPLVSTLIDRLRAVLSESTSTRLPPVRASPETQSAAQDWVDFHRHLASLPFSPESALASPSPLVSICITHYERPQLISQLLDSLLRQSYTNFEVVLVDDGSKSPAALARLEELDTMYFSNSTLLAGRPPWTSFRISNSYLGEARNRAAAAARGEWLLFLDDDDVLKPHALKTLVDVARRTNVSALSTWLDEFATDVDPLAPRPDNEELPHRRTYWFLGQELGAGLLLNCFGSGNIFVTRSAFDSIGGFSTYREVGAEDWEFYTRLALAGQKQLVVPEELIFVRSDPSRYSMKFSMDPWDAHFHALAPLLNDERIQELQLPHALMLLKGAVTKEAVPAAFADSRDGFQLVQGWGGWYYSFEPVADVPTLARDRLGVPSGDSFVLDRNRPLKPFINDVHQEGWVTPKGERIAAVRTFKSPKTMNVAIDLSYRSQHLCGDGTHLALSVVGGPGEAPQELVRFDTLEESFGEYRSHVSLRAGSMLHLSSDPLETDDCDRVETQLALTTIVLDNKSWSALAKKAEIERNEDSEPQSEPTKTTEWASVENKHVEQGNVFNIALIFDRNRYPHAKQVIRSARHYVKSRPVVFHLITPKDLHEDLEAFFDGTPLSLRLYDHELCGYVARRVLPFSDPGIHVSAHCKMFLSEILTYADRVLYLDTDTTITSDVSTCYDAPTRPTTLVSMAVDMGDICQRNPNQCWPIGLHWEVPPGLECGNVPAHTKSGDQPVSCAEAGELETIQVNGGVAMLELGKMREQGFVERYVQSIVHHYRLVGRRAEWGEQDFINSYFRLYPNDLELLPCGCNYQWFGSRREVKCGEQPVTIAHHWSHGIALRTRDPYNVLFHHFLDADPDSSTAPPPPFGLPPLSPSLPGAPNSSTIDIVHSLNCPRQDHDCSPRFAPTEYGQPVAVLSRILYETFAADLVDSLDAQTYPIITQAIAVSPGVDVPAASFDRDETELRGSVEDDYDELCSRCGPLAGPGGCTTPPQDSRERKAYFDCACSTPDSTALSMYDLEAFGSQAEGWILYLDDDKTFVSPSSLSLLMAEIDSTEELVVFRSNTTTGDHAFDFRKKILPRSSMDGIGYLFHSSHLPLTQWSATTRCGKWATFTSLAAKLRIKWIDLVPTMSHPLRRHLPETPSEVFKMTVIVLETQGRASWTTRLLDRLQEPELLNLVAEVVVASVDKTEDDYEPGVKVVRLSPGSGLAELGGLAESEKVLILSDSVFLDKAALTSLLTFHLDSPNRLVGLFTESSPNAFSPSLVTDPTEFDVFDEVDALVGTSRFTHLQPRTLLTTRSILRNLTSFVERSTAAAPDRLTREPLHPKCHAVLLSALSIEASGGQAPLRVLPPEQSVVDRVHDCRIRSWPEVDYGVSAGAVGAGEEDEVVERDPVGSDEPDGADDEADEEEDEEETAGEEQDDADLDLETLTDEQLQAIIDAEDPDEPSLRRQRKKRSPEWVDVPARPRPAELGRRRQARSTAAPSLSDCISRASALIGSSDWTGHVGTEVGVSGPLGVKFGVEKADEVDRERWERSRRIERCYKA